MAVTEQVARLLVEFQFDQAPEQALIAAKRNILDVVGVSLAAISLESGRIITSYVGDRSGKEETGVIGAGFRTSVENAALVAGVLAHAHLWEDTGSALIGHPSSPVTAAALPVGAWLGSSGQDVLRAYLMGFELEVKMGRAVNPALYELGWHSTSAVGTLGATVSAGLLLGLSVQQIQMALGIAVSLAAGTRQNFGTMTMPLHVGNAVRGGVMAALLARDGFNADPDGIGAPMGFANMFTSYGKYDLDRLTFGWANPLEVINPGSRHKLYPSGGPTNPAIDAVLDITINRDVHPEDVEEIHWAGARSIQKQLIRVEPQRGIEGKTSLQYCIAAAMVDREITMKQFTDEKVREPRIRDVMKKIRVTVHPEFAEDTYNYGCEVTIRLKDGTEHRRIVRKAKGHPDNPLSRDELLSKYRQCADLVLTESARERSIELLENLEKLPDIRELYETLCLLD